MRPKLNDPQCWRWAACVFSLLLIASCSSPQVDGTPYDIVIEATPIKVKEFEIGSVVDALEKKPEQQYMADAVVLFRVERTLMGNFLKVKRGGPSEFEQAQEAVRKRQILKLLTLDFEDPDEEYEKEWFTLAVDDVEKKFGITSRENPEPRVFRLYLQESPEHPQSLILVGVKLMRDTH